MKNVLQTALVVGFLTVWAGPASGGEIAVRNAGELRDALRRVRPDNTVTLAAGNYGNGLWIAKVNGTKKKPIIITGADEQKPPVFVGGAEAIHLSDCNYVVLRNIKISGCSGNGANADDGSSYDTPSTGIVFENITIEDIGPKGNRDGLKLENPDTPEMKVKSKDPRMRDVGAHAFEAKDAVMAPADTDKRRR